MNIVKFMLRAKEDFNGILSEMDDAESPGYLREMNGAAQGYLACIGAVADVLNWQREKTEDAPRGNADAIEDVLSEWYDILEKRSAIARDRLRETHPAAEDQATHKPQKQPPVDRGKLLIGLECCLADPSPLNVCSRHCPYGRDEECTGTVREDALAYIYYLEEQLDEARHGH